MERQALCLARTSLGGRIWARQQPETTLRFKRGTGLGRELFFFLRQQWEAPSSAAALVG